MDTINKCKCNIENGGYCERHSIYKNKHFVHLCITNNKYYDLWESGRGPGQFQSLESSFAPIEYPSTVGLAKNFGKAMINYVKSGFKNVTTEQYKERLKICSDCENYDDGRCKHPECGCFLAAKCWVSTERCPINKWPEYN